MPVIDLNINRIKKLTSGNITKKKILDTLPFLGLDIESQDGDQIRIEVQKEKSRGDIWQFYGKSFVEDQLACESSFAAMVVRLDDDKK